MSPKRTSPLAARYDKARERIAAIQEEIGRILHAFPELRRERARRISAPLGGVRHIRRIGVARVPKRDPV